jgi:general secretion pathway protein K
VIEGADRRRRGFAMITVLWLMTVASIAALAGVLAGRNGVNATRNRVQMERAFRQAMGCARRAQAVIDAVLRDAPSFDDAARRWRRVDHEVAQSASTMVGGCELRLEAAGTRLDVNVASDEMMDHLLRALGHGDDAIEMVDALADWRDADDAPRPSGAERDWYASAGRLLPRNADLADIRELARVRGFENLARYDTVLSTAPGRISLATAPVTVLMAVPGFTRETAEWIVALRDAGTPLRDLLELPAMLSSTSRDAMLARYSEIARITTVDPDAWILTAHVESGLPASVVVLEWRLVRAGHRALVVRSRVLE